MQFLKTEEEAVVLRKKAADCETRLIEADSKVNRLTHERNDLDARVGERVTELNAAYESINAVKREKCALEDMLRDTGTFTAASFPTLSLPVPVISSCVCYFVRRE